jgi:hypothetical protein
MPNSIKVTISNAPGIFWKSKKNIFRLFCITVFIIYRNLFTVMRTNYFRECTGDGTMRHQSLYLLSFLWGTDWGGGGGVEGGRWCRKEYINGRTKERKYVCRRCSFLKPKRQLSRGNWAAPPQRVHRVPGFLFQSSELAPSAPSPARDCCPSPLVSGEDTLA